MFRVVKKWTYTEPWIALSYAVGGVGLVAWSWAVWRQGTWIKHNVPPPFHNVRDLGYQSVLDKRRGQAWDPDRTEDFPTK